SSLSSSAPLLLLHSFPTRRSSDLLIIPALIWALLDNQFLHPLQFPVLTANGYLLLACFENKPLKLLPDSPPLHEKLVTTVHHNSPLHPKPLPVAKLLCSDFERFLLTFGGESNFV